VATDFSATASESVQAADRLHPIFSDQTTVDAVFHYYTSAPAEQIASAWDLVGQQESLPPHERLDMSSVTSQAVRDLRKVLDQASPVQRSLIVQRVFDRGNPHVLITSWPNSFAPLAVDIMHDGYDITPEAVDVLAARHYDYNPFRAEVGWARTRVIVASMAAASLEKREIDNPPVDRILRAYADFDKAMKARKIHPSERKALEDRTFRSHASFLDDWAKRSGL
jgi:hypothetical protein